MLVVFEVMEGEMSETTRKKIAATATSHDVRMALRKRYESPAWAMFHEVRNAAGFDAKRSADAIAMSTWPSRGLTLHGFEIKVHRSDWLRELKRPDKADPICRYCDYWWLVVGHDKVIHDSSEVPETWGLLEMKGAKLVVVRDAPKLEPMAIDRSFLACLLRAANEQGSVEPMLKRHRAEGYKEGYKEGYERAEQSLGYSSKNWEKRFTELNAKVREFEEAAGVSFRDGWKPAKKIGAVVKELLKGPVAHADELRRLLDFARRATAGVESAIKAMDEFYAADDK